MPQPYIRTIFHTQKNNNFDERLPLRNHMGFYKKTKGQSLLGAS